MIVERARHKERKFGAMANLISDNPTSPMELFHRFVEKRDRLAVMSTSRVSFQEEVPFPLSSKIWPQKSFAEFRDQRVLSQRNEDAMNTFFNSISLWQIKHSEEDQKLAVVRYNDLDNHHSVHPFKKVVTEKHLEDQQTWLEIMAAVKQLLEGDEEIVDLNVDELIAYFKEHHGEDKNWEQKEIELLRRLIQRLQKPQNEMINRDEAFTVTLTQRLETLLYN